MWRAEADGGFRDLIWRRAFIFLVNLFDDDRGEIGNRERGKQDSES